MKARRERTAAMKSVQDVDLSLPDPPEDGIAKDPVPFKHSRVDASRIVLREKRTNVGAGGMVQVRGRADADSQRDDADLARRR